MAGPEVQLLDLFWQLPPDQQLTLGGFALTLVALGVAGGVGFTRYQISKAYADVAKANTEKAGLQNKIDRLEAALEKSVQSLDDISAADFQKWLEKNPITISGGTF